MTMMASVEYMEPEGLIMEKLGLTLDQLTVTEIKRAMMSKGFAWTETRLLDSSICLWFSSGTGANYKSGWDHREECANMDFWLDTIIQAALNVLP